MPQAVALFIVTALGATGIGAALITAVVTVGFALGANALFGAIFGQSGPKPSDGQQTVRNTVGSRRRHYGIVHTGGQMSFLESRDGRLGIVVTLGTGREAEVLEHRINDKPVTIDAAGVVTTSGYRRAVRIFTQPGADDQAAIGALTAAFPEWTADHRQRGCAHAAIIGDPVKQEHFSEVYNGQRPAYTQVRKAALVYDPRRDSSRQIGTDLSGQPIMGNGPQRLDDPDSWAWSDNGPLVIADYFAHPDGYGAGYDAVNWANIADEADHADAQEITVTGEAIGRWRIWASYSLASEERRRVLTAMQLAVDGFSWQDADGLFNLMVGRWEAPTVVLTDDHILGMTATLGPKAQQQVDAIKVLYTEAAIGYREQESATVVNPAAVDDPATDPQAVQAYYIPHHNQATRVGKITLAQLGGDRWHIVAEINLFGLNLIGERFVRLASDQLGVDAFFKVGALRLDLVGLKVEATLDEVRPSDWDFDAATDEGTPPLAPGVVALDLSIVPAPTGLVLTAEQLPLGETGGVAIVASWADAGRPDLRVDAQYRLAGSDAWVPMAVDQDARTATSGPVANGQAHEVRLRAVTITGRSSSWTATKAITPTAVLALLPPTDLVTTGQAGKVTISLRAPTSPSLAYIRLYRGTGSFAEAVQIGADVVAALGEVMRIEDGGLPSGAHRYWARAFTTSGDGSAVVGPSIATVE